MSVNNTGQPKKLDKELTLLRNRLAELEALENSHLEELSRLTDELDKLRADNFFREAIVRHSPAFIVAIGADGNTIMMNDSLLATLGYSADEVAGTNYLDCFVPPSDRDSVKKVFDQLIVRNEPSVTENYILAKNGEQHLVEWHGRPVFTASGKPEYFFGIGMDITERRRAEQQHQSDLEALRKSEERYRFLTERLTDTVWTLGLNMRPTYVSPNSRKVTGYTPAERIRQHLSEMVTSETYARITDTLERELAREQDEDIDPDRFVLIEMEYYHKNGGTVWLENAVRAIRDRNGKIVGLHGISRDITDRKEAQRQLRESERKYRALVEQSADMLYLHDRDGVIYEVNRAAVAKTGYSREELLGMNVFDFFSGGVDRHTMMQLVEQWKPDEFPLTIEGRHRRSDGTDFPVETTAVKVFFDDTTYILSLVHDITNRKNMGEELLKARKLESVGTLAAGIAHDFNNLLAIIQGHVQLAKEALPGTKRYIDNLEAAISATGKAAELTGRLITFSAGGSPVREPKNMGALVENALRDIVSETSIQTDVHVPEDLLQANLDESQFRQVIRNMAENALEAMPDGGLLTVSLEKITASALNSIPATDGPYIRISLQDTGRGIPAEDLPFIFDPYFSRKQRGTKKGMGLGLAVCHSIVAKHGGCITVESSPGIGSVFHIYVPSLEADTRVPEESEQAETGRGIKRILIMDDEPEIRRLLKELLNTMGYRASTVGDGEEAVELYSTSMSSDATVFDLVMLDLSVKKGTGGLAAMERLRALDPGVKAIVFSGYTNDPVIENFKRYGFSGALTKPFKKEDIEALLVTIT